MTEVVAALIWNQDKFMICQRPAHKARGLLWEFVGGKVEPGETKEQALIRECQEELGVTLSVGEIFVDVVHEYSARRVKEMIQRQKEKYGWEFLFLGANIDAVETAGHLGIAPDRAVNYHCDSEGTRLNYEVVGQAVAAVRCSAPLDEHWKDAIEEDFRKRQKTGRR